MLYACVFHLHIVAASLLLLLLANCSNEKARALRSLNDKSIPLEAEQLTLAVSKNDEETLRQLILCGVSAVQCDSEGRSPLQIATLRSDYRATQLLLESGCPIDRDSNSQIASPLAAAVLNGDIPIAKALLAKGANPDDEIPGNGSLLVWSIKEGRFIIAEILIHKGANPDATDSAGNSALAHAIHREQRELTQLLLANGARAAVSSAQPGALKPMIIRCMELGWDELIPTLVEEGADLQATTVEGKTAADYALDAGKTELFNRLVKLGANNAAAGWEPRLRLALKENNLAQLKTLLNAGIKPNEKNSGDSLLHEALEKNQIDALKILLDQKFAMGTAYHLACERGNFDAVKLIESYGYETPTTGLGAFDSPLHCAIRSGKVDLVDHLLGMNMDIHELGHDNQTALVCAIARQEVPIVKRLLEAKADANRKLEQQANDSFLATIKNSSMKWYLRKDKNITPLMLAADAGNLDIAKLLLEHGASKSTWTSVNKTWPLNFASHHNDVPMMRLLLNKDPLNEERKIVVKLADQRATLFNSAGEVVYTTKVSTGKKGFSTPKGVYVITNKYVNWKSTIYDGASMPNFQRLSCSDFGFHQGVVPGYPASHGCLRVPSGNAQKLYALTQLGDRVIIE